jgi:ATP-dependent exoDNAse (exonuclease V) alpha subunit
MLLNDNQTQAFQYIINHLPKEKVILLEGSAGTGKTTLTKNICNYYREKKNLLVCAIAPTHKSKKIIKNVLNKDTILPVSAMTIASALGKIKEHSYIGTKIYSNGSNKKLSCYRLLIIDEVSMISNNDLRIVIDYAVKNNKQLLIIGDRNQIPCPNAGYLISDVIQKKDSFIFTDTNITKLTLSEIMQGKLYLFKILIY